MRFALCSWLCLLLGLSSCVSEQTYSLDELLNNHYNELGIPVTPALEAEGFDAIFEQYQPMEQGILEDYLMSTPLELHEASYGLYYLANAYAKSGALDGALKYHLAAAEHYLNPLSYLKLAERSFFQLQEYREAYIYLHHALELITEITGNNRSHPLARNTKEKAQFMLQELERLGDQGAFDKKATREELKQVLPPLMEQYRKLYQLDVPS